MSVNAINAADAPQQKKSNAGTAIGAGLGLGALGATAGYFMGNKRPSLEELLKDSNNDTFTKSEVTSIDSEAASKLAAAKEEYRNAGAAEKNDLKVASQNYGTELRNTAPENANLVSDYQTAKSNFDAKKVKIGDVEKSFAEVKAELDAANNAVKNLAADADEAAKTAANTRLTKAKADMQAFKNGASTEITELKAKSKALIDGRKAKFNANAATDGNAKTVKEALETAKTKFTDAKTKKLNELLTDDLKAAFDKVKKAFPKEGGWKKAGIYGGIAAVVGLLAGALLGGKKEA